MTTFRVAVERALHGVGPFSRPVAESILEIAYLTMAADKELRDEEIEAFSIIAAVMLGKRVTAGPGSSSGSAPKLDDAELRTWLDRFGEQLDKSTMNERLEAAVRRIGDDPAARRESYRIACLVSMSDLDAADREFEFDLDLIAMLGLTQDDADAILAEVNAAVTPDETN